MRIVLGILTVAVSGCATATPGSPVGPVASKAIITGADSLQLLPHAWTRLTYHYPPFEYLFWFTAPMIAESGHADLPTFLEAETHFRPVPCAFNSFHRTCVQRGTVRERVWVRLDNRDGDFVERLKHVDLADVVLVAVEGASINVFTRSFLEEIARNPQLLLRRFIRSYR